MCFASISNHSSVHQLWATEYKVNNCLTLMAGVLFFLSISIPHWVHR